MENNEILNENLRALGSYNYAIISDLMKLDLSKIKNVKEEKTNTGLSTLYIEKDSKNILLHSKYDPIKDAKRLINNIDFDRDSLIIVFGLGLAYHLFELKERISEDTRVFIIEHNEDVLKYALNNVDLTSIFETPQFFLIFGNEKTMNFQILAQVSSNFYNMAYNMQSVILPNYHIYDEENLRAMKQITNRISNTIVSYGNSLEDMFVGFTNNYLNVDAIIKSNSIDEIRGKYKDKPGIVVASGPSLEKNIHHLKDANEKALIICCDASLKACEINGVKPDATASIERDEPTYTFYYKDKEIDKDIVLVGPGVLWPKIYEEYKGKTIIMSKTNDGIEGWWSDHFENMKFVNQGQSSATVAFAVAKEAGCNPIILIGQDLAYSYGKKHSDITHTEFEGTNDDREAEGNEVYLKDYEGNLLKSDWIYEIFKTWFEYQIIVNPDLEVIDATEGGAYIEGSKVMKLKDVIERYCNTPLKNRMIEYLKDIEITENEKFEKYKIINKSIEEEITKLEKIKEKASKYFDFLEKIRKEFKFEECDEDTLEKIIIKMQAGNDIIQEILYSEDAIRVFYKQIITQTIMHVKKIGNKLTGENVKRNHELQLNLMYMMKESTEHIIKEYEKASEFIKSKLE